jgi:hypothetical protein
MWGAHGNFHQNSTVLKGGKMNDFSVDKTDIYYLKISDQGQY